MLTYPQLSALALTPPPLTTPIKHSPSLLLAAHCIFPGYVGRWGKERGGGKALPASAWRTVNDSGELHCVSDCVVVDNDVEIVTEAREVALDLGSLPPSPARVQSVYPVE